MTRPEAARIVAVIIAAYPTQAARLDRDRMASMVDAFEMLLADLEYEQVDAAVRVLLQTQTFMPSIAEIRAGVLRLELGGVRSGVDAWGDVLGAVNRFGFYRSPVFGDELVARCVARIGWRTICLADETDASNRARFVELYNHLARDERQRQQSPLLAAADEQRALPEGQRAADVDAIVMSLARMTLHPDDPNYEDEQ